MVVATLSPIESVGLGGLMRRLAVLFLFVLAAATVPGVGGAGAAPSGPAAGRPGATRAAPARAPRHGRAVQLPRHRPPPERLGHGVRS